MCDRFMLHTLRLEIVGRRNFAYAGRCSWIEDEALRSGRQPEWWADLPFERLASVSYAKKHQRFFEANSFTPLAVTWCVCRFRCQGSEGPAKASLVPK